MPSGDPTPGRSKDQTSADSPSAALFGMFLVLLFAALAFAAIELRAPRRPRDMGPQILVQRVYNAAAEFRSVVSQPAACPAIEDLVAERLILPEQTLDPWWKQIRVDCRGGTVLEARSAGRDGRFGTEDDIPYSEERDP
jgi:hypothetical protein